MVFKKKDTVAFFYSYPLWIILAACSLFSCNDQAASMEEMKEYTGPLMEIDTLETLYSDSSILRIRFNAGKQLEFVNGNKEFLNGVKIEFFNEKGESEATLTSQKGYQDKQSAIYKVVGDVVVQNIKEKKSLHTEKLFWDSKSKKIYTTDFVKIQTPKEVLTGEGLEAAQDFSKYKITKPTGIFLLE
jgi:LPS export ABC transporter protein LptC